MSESNEFDFLYTGVSRVDAIYFHAPDDEYGFLSNRYLACFELDGMMFTSCEQFIMYQKCKILGEHGIANKIMATNDPDKQKELARSTSKYNEKLWSGRRQAVTMRGLLAKFSQNEDILEKLLATGDAYLVDAIWSDRTWACGLSLKSVDLRNMSKWRGANILGFSLMEVRTILAEQKKCTSTRMSYRIAEWNINGEDTEACETYVADRLYENKPDFIVLTEYVESENYDANYSNGKFEQKLRESGYKIFRQPENVKGNAILIAVKDSPDFLVDCKKRIYKVESQTGSSPEILIANFDVMDGSRRYPLTIAGLRIKPSADYQDRMAQLKNALEYIDTLSSEYSSNIILAGDFNNGLISEEYTGPDTEFYNYQMIIDEFKNHGYEIKNNTPDGDVYSFKNLRGEYKQDHIFTRGMTVDNCVYDWNWKKKDNQKEIGNDPDHAMLISNVSKVKE